MEAHPARLMKEVMIKSVMIVFLVVSVSVMWKEHG
jgi:hypothetical protein